MHKYIHGMANLGCKLKILRLVPTFVVPFVGTLACAGELSYTGQVPRDQAVIQMTKPQSAGETVSSYTGQHMETFPLLTLPAGSLGSVSLGLSYSGNVNQQAAMLNNEAQASWIGLGFDLVVSPIAIISDHKFSVSPQDDDYYLTGVGSQPVRLLDSGSFFYPANEAKLRAERHTELVLGKEYVSGWTVWSQDGTVYQLGDSVAGCCPSVRSSTWYELHWGEHVGIGVSNGDRLIPTRWYVRRAERGSGSFINYTYAQETEKLQVYNSPNQLSTLAYTRDLYPEAIETYTGYKVEFYSSPRDDFMSTAGPAEVYPYRKVKLDSLVVKYGNNSQSRVQFSYSYLYPQADSTKKKLLLDGFTAVGVDVNSALPPTQFSYYTDAESGSLGAIKTVTYPSGATKELLYRNLDASEVLSDLNHIPARSYAVQPKYAVSRDVLLSKFRLQGEELYKYEVAAWNGFWDARILDGVTDTHPDTAIAAGEGWAVLYNRDITGPRGAGVGGFIHLEFSGGAWVRDTVFPSWGPPSYTVKVLAGNDYFIALNTKHEVCIDCDREQVRWAYFYKQVDTGWTEHLIFDAGGFSDYVLFSGVMLAPDIYAIRLWDPQARDNSNDDRYCVHYGKFTHAGDDLVKSWTDWAVFGTDELYFTAGPNYVAYGGEDSRFLRIVDFDESTLALETIDLGVSHQLKRLIPLHDGVAVMTNGFCQTYMRTEYPSYGWDGLSYVVCWDGSNDLLCVGGNSFVMKKTCGSCQEVQYWEWNGVGWTQTSLWCGNPWDRIVATKDVVAFWSCPAKQLWAVRHTGFGEFSQLQLLDNDIRFYHGDAFVTECDFWPPALSVARDIVVACGEDAAYNPERWAFVWNEVSSNWAAVDIDPFTDPLPNQVYPIAFRGRFFLDVTEGNYSTFQLYKSGITGKPSMAVVDTVWVYPDGDLQGEAIGKSFDYAGGILDEGANTPRFARGTASSPFFLTQADTAFVIYQTDYFFNDLDDSHIDRPDLFLPDLESQSTFGLTNGGFALDGAPYLSFADTILPADTTYLDTLCYYCSNPEPPPGDGCFAWELGTCPSPDDSSVVIAVPVGQDLDQSRRYYSVRLRRESSGSLPPYTIYNPYSMSRTLPDSTLSQSDGTQQVTRYRYDDFDRRIRAEMETIKGVVSVDSVVYAGYTEYPPVANAVSRIKYLMDIATETKQFLLRDSTTWASRSQAKCRHTWHDASDNSAATAITSYALLEDQPGLGLDAFDNVLCWRRVSDTCSAKYSPSGDRLIATIQNGLTSGVFVFDAEYDFDVNGVGYDGWTNVAGTGGYLTDAESLSGLRSYAMVTPTDSEPGLCRFVQADSLSRPEYVLSFWALSDEILVVSVTEYSGGVPSECLPARTVDASLQSGWSKHELLLHVGDCVDAETDSLSIVIGIQNQPGGSGVNYFDDIRLHPVGALVATSTASTSTGLTTSRSGPDNLPTLYEYDALHRLWRMRDHTGQLLSEQEYFFSHSAHGGSYYATDPNYIKTVSYGDGNSTTSVSFSDGTGRHLQSRSSIDFAGSASTLVTGAVTYDSRQQEVITYKPYVDLVDDTGLEDYSLPSDVPNEVDYFYDGTHAVDCGLKAYSENVYKREARTRMAETASPGPDHSVGSGHTVRYDYSIEVSPEYDTLKVTTVTDQDGIQVVSKAEHRGEFNSQISYYVKGGQPDSVITITFSDPMAQTAETVIDTGGAVIPLRREYTNDSGLPDSTWKVDYGTIRMLYDDAGNLRFMQNDQRKLENNFVYYKYDGLGRKTEEGILADPYGEYFTQDSASVCEFPGADKSPDVKYRWYYDSYSDLAVTLVAPGRLVRVQDAQGDYYRNFYYFPEQLRDSAVVKLPFKTGGSLKSIVHSYGKDGSLKQLRVYPKLSQPGSVRTISYTYDTAGRLSSITRGEGAPLTYADYSYEADGSIRQTRVGVNPGTGEAVQVVDLIYDPLGRLSGINDPSTVVASNSGTGIPNDHFGQGLVYHDPVTSEGFFNGRVSSSECAVSNSGTVKKHLHQYDYNSLGWLEEALVDGDNADPNSRRYYYNALGQRVAMAQSAGATYDSTDYEYYTNTPGSSRLKRFTDMPVYFDMQYDTLGNLVKDQSRSLDTLLYDYRNLMRFTKVPSMLCEDAYDSMRFVYDESGMRIKKHFCYWGQQWFEGECPSGSGCPGGGMMMMEGGEATFYQPPEPPDPDPDPDPDPVLCTVEAESERLYLYDGGVLVATFDKSDNVRELFVNGPGGPIAFYDKNLTDYIYYLLTDHLGSTRLVMNDFQVSQWYAYHPFGELIEASGYQGTPFQFTGKERDGLGAGELDYFGARYYDARVGFFTSLDKASQFANGYVYGGNNPTLGSDPDGNLFFMLTPAFISGFASGVFWSYVQQDMAHKPISGWKLLGHGFAGGFGSYIGSFGRPDKLGVNIRQSMYQSLVSNTMSNIVDNPDPRDAGLWFKNSGYAAAVGVAQGILTSEHFSNLLTDGSFRSNDSHCRWLVNQGRYVDAQRYINRKLGLGFPKEKMEGYDDDESRPPAVQRLNKRTGNWSIGHQLCDEQGLCKENLFASAAVHEYNHYEAFTGKASGILRIAGTLAYHDSWEAIQLVELHAYSLQLELANRIPLNSRAHDAILERKIPRLRDIYPLFRTFDNSQREFLRSFTLWPAAMQGFYIF